MYEKFIYHSQSKRKYFTTASEVSRPKNLAKSPLFKENYLPAGEDKSRYSVITKAPIQQSFALSSSLNACHHRKEISQCARNHKPHIDELPL